MKKCVLMFLSLLKVKKNAAGNLPDGGFLNYAIAETFKLAM